MTKQELVNLLHAGIERADAEGTDTVTISCREASEIAEMLSSIREMAPPWTGKKGQVDFYCSDCGKSFWADPKEDPECFAKYHYRRWYAACPACGREVMRNDHYWR